MPTKNSKVLGIRLKMPKYEQVGQEAEKRGLSLSKTGEQLIDSGFEHYYNCNNNSKEKVVYKDRVIEKPVYIEKPIEKIVEKKVYIEKPKDKLLPHSVHIVDEEHYRGDNLNPGSVLSGNMLTTRDRNDPPLKNISGAKEIPQNSKGSSVAGWVIGGSLLTLSIWGLWKYLSKRT